MLGRGGVRGARSVQKPVWIMKSSMAAPMEAPTAAIFRYQPANLMIWFGPSESSRAGVATGWRELRWRRGGGGDFEAAGDESLAEACNMGARPGPPRPNTITWESNLKQLERDCNHLHIIAILKLRPRIYNWTCNFGSFSIEQENQITEWIVCDRQHLQCECLSRM